MEVSGKNDGGPAFPFNAVDGVHGTLEGMTLRDYYKAKIAPSVVVGFLNSNEQHIPVTKLPYDEIASICGKLADAMLAEREKGGAK